MVLSVNSSYGCDSAVLSILTGSSPQAIFLSRLLAVSQKLQIEGEMLNAFNIAAARKQHREIMENWLQTVSESYLSSPVVETYAKEYSLLLIGIAKDLGAVRKKLDADSMDTVHEIIEACITKISVLGAIVNEKQHIYEFLKFELMIYLPRPFIKDIKKFKSMTVFSSVEEKISEFKKNYSEKACILADELGICIGTYLRRSDESNIDVSSCATLYNDVVNRFVLLKKQLLDDRYFEK